MAQFTTHGCLKTLFNGEGFSFPSEQKDPFHFKFRSIQSRELKVRCIGSFLSYPSSKRNRCNAEALPSPTFSNGHVRDDDYPDHDDYDFYNDSLASFRGLALDVSYRPVNVVSWKRAIYVWSLWRRFTLIGLCYYFCFISRADVLEYYFYIPAVLRVPNLLQVVKRRVVNSNLNRKNILYRDFTCQYCSSRENLTIDHVVPASLGGEWKWENLATACAKYNSRTGQKTLEEAEMKLINTPKAPKEYDIHAILLTSAALRMLTVRKGTPEEWLQYLSRSS